MPDSRDARLQQLRASIAALEAQRAILGPSADPALELLRRELAALEQNVPAPGAGADARLADLRRSAPDALARKILSTRSEDEGARKPVTILFADIVGSTSLAAQVDPEEWKEIVTGVHHRVGEAVYRYEGTIAQLLGDGVLAFFGAPLTHEDDPLRAVRAAVDMQQAMRAYAVELSVFFDSFEIRIGIHTGDVVVGTVGDDLHMEYLAIGDSVNLAARLQSAARPGGILISSATARLVRPAVDLQSRAELAVKGKPEAVTVWEVTGLKRSAERARGIEGLASPFVGRDRERTALNEALNRLTEGHGEIVAVLGEAGIGKTRLVEEAHRSLHDPTSVHWLEGRALSYGQTLSFWTFAQLLQNDLGLTDGAPEARARVALKRRLSALFAERASEIAPYLSNLLGFKPEGEAAERVQALDGETRKRQTIVSLADYFSRVAKQKPTVLVFEDLHWADPSSLDALEQLLALTDRVPLMILLLMRVEREHRSWQIHLKAETEYEHRFTELHLEALSPADSNLLVNQLLAVADLPESIRTLILGRSEGNPFYLEEIIRSLIEQGALMHEGETWRATDQILHVAIPDTLQGVLLARIDRLQEEVRRTLQLASVIGRSFLYRLLEGIAAEERQLDEHLAQLQRADLVREKTRRPELEYVFKHSLTQEATYNSLLVERRKEFHRRVGEALEQLFPDRREEFLGILAHHFDAAGERVKAIDYWIQWGDQQRMGDAHVEAIQSYRRAVELLTETGDLERAAKTWLKLGLLYAVNFEFEEAHRANEMAFALERERRTRLPHAAPATPERERNAVRISFVGPQLATLDPSRLHFNSEWFVATHLFVGLAEFDSDTNVVPCAARSWEVLDGGTRYLFHLRDDMQWTDGARVTALDFEWTWRRNLAPGARVSYPALLDDILGAGDFREGRNLDPESLGIRALDQFTFEVRLASPVAYFMYLVAHPITFALPRATVERNGDKWWLPQLIVSNGAFRLAEYDEDHGRIVRNESYFGDFTGNVDEFVWSRRASREQVIQDYLSGQTNSLGGLAPDEIPAEATPEERLRERGLSTTALTLIPAAPPMDDVRVRRAIVHGLDRKQLYAVRLGSTSHFTGGGVIPPGMAGHSPEIGLAFDPELARQLLAEAGYPGGNGIRVLMYHYPDGVPESFRDELRRQFAEHLGIQIEMGPMAPDRGWWTVEGSDLQTGGWIADYPDPDNFLHHSAFYLTLCGHGWHNARFEEILHTAARTTDRARRMALYREADHLLVEEEALVIPIFYPPSESFVLNKPWVKGFRQNALNQVCLREITIEPH